MEELSKLGLTSLTSEEMAETIVQTPSLTNGTPTWNLQLTGTPPDTITYSKWTKEKVEGSTVPIDRKVSTEVTAIQCALYSCLNTIN